ncbi:hypothetical protein SELR_pSRC400070 (plasmid) [Selenomonas ruminantium subsp. lactilytica TAM6421]|uniref:Uncharacterized protein n=1 Tax=Selenomonas ruminantium subsp. lactilytica (strain NBRC 103574 / TAM6421) TaxID=927704 RepID=I0GV71_SELRL|nr:hypothetical protein [Selenomonas ruminantium]BAL84658.1 hypothetical protein SELR_pSRC400070 [Selenomonas ruminantium subsp. lactilytica TAM6421]
MKIRVYFKKITEGDVVIDVPDDTPTCDYREIAEREHSDMDLYVGADRFEMTDYELEEE